MKYAIAFGIFLVLMIVSAVLWRHLFKVKRRRTWAIVITFDLLFAILSLVYFYLLDLRWYLYIAIPLANFLIIFISGKFLIDKTVFNRRLLSNG